ncbi:pyridoxine 5'-phosphate synthase [Mastigocoleus testarum]|uniref:Pyridoxine 5'-phosphate synthase n=1 Tax=Mastigocoleus testarum BC008 TaxID=371196 RepID=A0A0V7ZUR7_9CYAN|nr:pyridoxine 5'-phosphate synthase [Mastigocoleus testarum]KST64099.1 pyridoxine 5'-phosphate synthase [Mastigocoleus testarum BC008]KST68281.1 pyridoxine 5'-phosphate synthase [Mastigocoleus testarum BC008]
MTKLSVNINRVALLRNSRNIGIPSVINAAKIVINAGAYGVTVHPRPDQRHIKPADVYELAEMLALPEFKNIEFNIEGNPFESNFMDMVCEVKPTQCTLVPDAPDAFTSDSGWNLSKDSDRLKPIVQKLKSFGIRVSLFMDADVTQIPLAKDVGADRIELYTEPYATAFRDGDVETVFPKYFEAAKVALESGLGVNAGHDLNLENLGKFCSIPNILEVSIGHALIAEALEMGLHNTVKAYLEILSST